jgi:predicted transcriptional regulator
MNNIIKTDILNVLNNSLKFIDRQDYISLKDLSNHVIHNSSIFQDSDSINIAVLIYCISKIFDRDKDIHPKIIQLVKEMKNNLIENRYKDYEKNIKMMYKTISKHDNKLKMYITQVIEMAQVKKGSKIYDHGISLQQSAEILGISQWELMEYLGSTKIVDSFDDDAEGINERLNFVKKLFGLNIKD